MTERVTNRRFVIVAAALCLVFGGLLYHLGSLHLGRADRQRERLSRMRRYESQMQAERGRIYDGSRNQTVLALNIAVKDVCVAPSNVVAAGGVERMVEALAPALALPPEELRRKLSKPTSQFEYLARFVPEAEAYALTNRLAPADRRRLFFQDSQVRHFTQADRASQVLGFVNFEGQGSAGVEQSLEKYLQGVPGRRAGQLDGHRRELTERRDFDVPPQAGADVYLTLDENIQSVAERALQQAVEQHHAQGGCLIVERVKTGEILAMASRPTFDPNRFRTATDPQKLNRAIGHVYEPGSTFKPAVIAAALNEGLVTPATVFDCENGSWLYQNRPLRDFHRYGFLSVSDIIKKSSNIGAAKIALLLGNDRMEQYLRAFGIGHTLGIDLPGEENGILHPAAKWTPISPTRIAIGQGVAVTALQMLGVVCAIANDGILMRPYIIDRVVRRDGTVLLQHIPERISTPIRRETAAVMREVLAGVTEDGGTGKRAAIDGYRVGGKTGTAQKAMGGRYSESCYMASFVGFFPVENPEIAMIVVIDEPQPLHTGGLVSAPVFAQVAEPVARYLDIPASDYRPAAMSAGDDANGF